MRYGVNNPSRIDVRATVVVDVCYARCAYRDRRNHKIHENHKQTYHNHGIRSCRSVPQTMQRTNLRRWKKEGDNPVCAYAQNYD